MRDEFPGRRRPRPGAVDGLLAVGLSAAALALYLRTLPPSVLYGDSAELQTLAYTPGMTHPTGFPVYVLVARAFTFLLPIGDPAWRVNLISALCAAGAVGVLHLVGRRLDVPPAAAAAGPLALAVSALYWWQAVIAELYAPGALLTALVLLLLLTWRRDRRPRLLLAAGLVGGLSLGVHIAVALLAPATVVYLALRRATFREWRHAIAGALLGLLATLGGFLLVDWLAPPPSYFEQVRLDLSLYRLQESDLDTPWERLWFMVSGREFRDVLFSGEAPSAIKSARNYVGTARRDFSPVALGLMAVGLVVLWRRHRPEAAMGTLSCLLTLVFVFNYNMDDVYVYYIQTYAFLAVLVGPGVKALAEAVARRHPRRVPAGPRAVALGVLVVVLAWPGAGHVVRGAIAGHITFLESRGYPDDLSAPHVPRQRVERVLRYLEDDAIVFTDWQMLHAYYYVAHVEQARTGTRFYGLRKRGGVARTKLDFIAANVGARPIYVQAPALELDEVVAQAPWVPAGVVLPGDGVVDLLAQRAWAEVGLLTRLRKRP